MAEESGKTFFSYAREDSTFVLRLVKDLRAAGADVWLDQLDIGAGRHWDTAIENALRACPCHVTVLSPDAVASQDVRNEYSFALEERKQVIPLLYRECAIPFRLRLLQYVDFRTDYEKGFRDLAKALGIRKVSAVPAPLVETVDMQKPSTQSPQIQAGNQAVADAQAVQPAPMAEQLRPTIAVNETPNQEDRRKIVEGQRVSPVPPIMSTTKILWGLGAGLIVLVLIIWITSGKAPDNSDGSGQVPPTATPTAPDNGQAEASDAEAFFNRGDNLYDEKQYDQAIDAFTQAIRLKPDYPDAYNERGMAYDEKGEYDLAIQDYTQAVKLNPNYAEAYYNRGISYANKGDYNQAVQDYTHALKLNPNDADVYNNRRVAYANNGDYNQAVLDYTRALKLKPDDAGVYSNRGSAYQNNKQYEQALQDYDHALQFDPNAENARKNRDALAAYLKTQGGK
jgi:Flp pilus assembly protein TadD